jgi:HK97 family phage portal protein
MSLFHSGSRGFFATGPTWPHDPNDERAWGGGPYYQTTSGVTIDYPTALRVSCIFQGVRLIGQTIGSLPVRVLRDLGGGRKEEARDHVVRRLMMKRPNSWQTPKQFRETLTAWSILWGMGLAEIRPGPSGAFEELWPIEPSWITPEKIRGTNRLRFVVDEPGEARRVLVQDQVFRLDGFGLSSCIGESVLKLAREAIGLWISHEKFQGLYFSQGAKPSVWITHPGKLGAEAYLRMKTDIQGKYGGWHNAQKVALLEENQTVKETGWNLEQSQAVEAKKALVEEMARFMNLSPQFFMLVDEPTHASAEVFNQQVIDYTFLPHAVAWEQSVGRDLLFEEEDDIYVKHIFDALLRGSTLERAQAYAQFVMNGILSENECRIREDLDPRPGLDEPRRSVNQDRGAAPGGSGSNPPPASPPAPARKKKKGKGAAIATVPTRYLLMAENDAARVVRRELQAISDKGAKHASDPAAWASWVDDFYRGHETMVAEAMQLPPMLSRRYVEKHRDALKERGLSAAETWERDAVEELKELAVSV